MFTTLTPAQIAIFGEFRNHIEETLKSHTKGIKGGNRLAKDKKAVSFFLDLLVNVSRQSKLSRVLNSQKALEERGFTKSNIQKARTTTRWGKQVRELVTRPDGSPDYLFTPRCAVMYTTEAYRKLRAEETGSTTPETVYVLPWKYVPSDMQEKMGNQFPRPTSKDGKPYPVFTPVGIGVVVKQGKVVDGVRRQWARLQFLVLAKYGERSVVIPDIIIWDREACDGKNVIQRLAEVTGAPENVIPYWPEEAEIEQAPAPLAQAASTQAVLQNDFNFAF
jgi:hypothetical protein